MALNNFAALTVGIG